MKTKDIAIQYQINKDDFECYLRRTNQGTEGLMSFTVADQNVADVVNNYKTYKTNEKAKSEKKAAIAAQKAEEEEREKAYKQKCLSEMLITSGFNFDGYSIKKYSGYISGDDCVTIPRDNFWGNNKVDQNLCGALVKIRRQAIKELKEAAYNLGCNAVIGVDFDYLTMDPQHAAPLNAQATIYEPYVICVTANGNAVIIEKDE